MRPSILVDLALGATIAVVVAVVAVVQFIPPPGVTILGATDDAMAPGLPAGTAIVARDVPYTELRAGDVIAFQPPGPGPLLRRIEEIRSLGPSLPDTYLVVRADDRPTPEPVLVRAHRVLGRVDASVPLLGYLVAAASSSLGMWAIVSILGSLLTVRLLWDEVRAPARRRLLLPELGAAAIPEVGTAGRS